VSLFRELPARFSPEGLGNIPYLRDILLDILLPFFYIGPTLKQVLIISFEQPHQFAEGVHSVIGDGHITPDSGMLSSRVVGQVLTPAG
jgi:hypothetical protein